MKLQLNRHYFFPTCTHGSLKVDGHYFCDTLEPHCIDYEKEKKEYGKTAIPDGKYEIVMSWSSHFHRFMPFLRDVPWFSGIMIHPGNKASETKGCILVGKYYDEAFITDSKKKFEALYSMIQDAYAANEDIWIEITQ